MKYNFNGTEIELRDKLCKLWDNDCGTMTPQVNLYVRIGNSCNADCKFCTYHGENTEFNLEKFEDAIKELYNRGILGKIQITGGEPSLYRDRLILVLRIVRKYFPDRFVSINSNGYDLLTLIEVKDLVDNFAISRHHYDEDINRQIFNNLNVPLANQLKVFIQVVGSEKIHFSCTLCKDGIHNLDEVKKYLEFCSSIGCNDVGFVTLMDTNKFAIDNQIVFDNIGIEESSDFLKHTEYTKAGGCCRCANYLYLCKSTNKLIDIYGRFVAEKDNTPGIISFDIDTLREGFNGKIIRI